MYYGSQTAEAIPLEEQTTESILSQLETLGNTIASRRAEGMDVPDSFYQNLAALEAELARRESLVSHTDGMKTRDWIAYGGLGLGVVVLFLLLRG